MGKSTTDQTWEYIARDVGQIVVPWSQGLKRQGIKIPACELSFLEMLIRNALLTAVLMAEDGTYQLGE